MATQMRLSGVLKELAEDPEKDKMERKQWTILVLDKLSKLENIPSREVVVDIVRKAGGDYFEFFGADYHFAPTMSLEYRYELNVMHFENGSNEVRSAIPREYANYIKDREHAKREIYAPMNAAFELSSIKVQKALNNVKINKPEDMLQWNCYKVVLGKIGDS